MWQPLSAAKYPGPLPAYSASCSSIVPDSISTSVSPESVSRRQVYQAIMRPCSRAVLTSTLGCASSSSSTASSRLAARYACLTPCWGGTLLCSCLLCLCLPQHAIAGTAAASCAAPPAASAAYNICQPSQLLSAKLKQLHDEAPAALIAGFELLTGSSGSCQPSISHVSSLARITQGLTNPPRRNQRTVAESVAAAALRDALPMSHLV